MKCLLLIPLLFLTSCATRPKTYVPPDPGKLTRSTQRVSVAVDSAHAHAKEAKTKVDQASQIAKEIGEETRRLKEVPVTLVARTNDLERKLDETRTVQLALERDLVEATDAKAQVEKDKTEYFSAAQRLADSASDERSKRIAAEKEASHLKWNSWIYRILGTVGVILMIGFLVLWFMGKIALKLSG